MAHLSGRMTVCLHQPRSSSHGPSSRKERPSSFRRRTPPPSSSSSSSSDAPNPNEVLSQTQEVLRERLPSMGASSG
jgi:hypothetical protein